MQINGKGRIDPGALTGAKSGAAERSAPAQRTDAVSPTAERAKQDSVSFSTEARALASGSVSSTAAGSARVEEVRQRMLMGAYNTAEMAGEVAKRILERGDI
jgi:anti-sigma28 factor (negative regulator of flagellin synthesis)